MIFKKTAWTIPIAIASCGPSVPGPNLIAPWVLHSQQWLPWWFHPSKRVQLGCFTSSTLAAAGPYQSHIFTRPSFTLTGSPPCYWAVFAPAWGRSVIPPSSNSAHFQAALQAITSPLQLPGLTSALLRSIHSLHHDLMVLSSQLWILRVHRGLRHLLWASLVVQHVVPHVNKLLFTSVTSFLLRGLGYAYQFVSSTLQNLSKGTFFSWAWSRIWSAASSGSWHIAKSWSSQDFFRSSFQRPATATLKSVTLKSCRLLIMSNWATSILYPMASASCNPLTLPFSCFRLWAWISSPSTFWFVWLGHGYFLLWSSTLAPSFSRRLQIALMVFTGSPLPASTASPCVLSRYPI